MSGGFPLIVRTARLAAECVARIEDHEDPRAFLAALSEPLFDLVEACGYKLPEIPDEWVQS